MLNFLSDNTAIATLLVLTLLVMLLFAIVIWAAMKGAEKADKPADQKPRQISADSLKQSFRVAVELIENNIAARSERYNLAWTLVLNEGGAGRELPLLQSGLQSALSADSTLTAGAQGINWNFFDQGIAVQLHSDSLGTPDADAADASAMANTTWDDFLGLCRNYRPDRPFDSIVVALPASVLLDVEGAGQLDLAARAKAIHRRLWLAQNRLALRFPIYLAISDCETIPGFARFAAALPEPLRRSMLGWSSPHELVAPFQAQWIDTAMNEIGRTLSDSCAELCALEPSDSDSSEYFLLPNQVERLRAGLKMFAEELMRPSAYHEPFLLRGIYLTGDCSDEAALLGEGHAPAAADNDGFMAVEPAAASATAALPDWAEPSLAADAPAYRAGRDSAVPAFLRDIFERKIFAEAGLVRSSSVHRMRRPAMNRVARWCAIALPVVWVLGLVFSTLRLHGLGAEVVSNLQALNHDTRMSQLVKNNHVVDAQRSQQRALEALASIEQISNARLWSAFMPGSWPWFNDLQDQVQRRMEKSFAETAFDPLLRAAYTRVSELTGKPLDASSGTLIIGRLCAAPKGMKQPGVAGGLDVTSTQEYAALSAYVEGVTQLEQAVQAMMRLKSPGAEAPSGEDLAQVVNVLFNREMNGNLSRTAALFSTVAKTKPTLAIEPMQEAAVCSFGLGVKALSNRLFLNNGLLKAEQGVNDSLAALYQGDPKAEVNVAPWLALRDALHAQEAYLLTGTGGWMRGEKLDLGPAWAHLLQQVESAALLGKDAADNARSQTEDGFRWFSAQWDAPMADERHAQGLSSGLEWLDAKSSWAFAPDRRALLDALNGLLSLPFMKSSHVSRLPEMAAGSTVSWDGARLDQVLALADARKRVQAEFLPKFPIMLQGPAGRLADAALADTARDILAQAYLVSARDTPAPINEADHAKALRVRAWLQENGGAGVAEHLSGVLTQDALSRLQQLDDTLTRADLFTPRDRAFHSWNGAKGPLVDAFGASDVGGLHAYVGQQIGFIEAAGKSAEALLLQLGGAAANNPSVLRWQATVADLGRYKLKSPSSSLTTLEQFILSGAADLSIDNCLDKLSARAAQRRAGDLFSERMQGLQMGLYMRCRDLTQTRYQDTWTRFADAFNASLASRAPFRALTADAGGKGAPGERVPADVEEVGAVLKLFDQAHVLALASDRDATRPSPASTVRKVDDQMQKVREFLAPLYPAEEGQAAGLDVMVEFRANTAVESEGNKIIDWSLAIGGQTVHQRDAPRPLRWEPGLPVVLTLRVAQDGPVVPKAEAGHPGMTVDERTVSYRFDDPWALFSLVSAYREAEAAPASGARSQLLKFEFPMSAVGDGRIATRDSRAKVYVRLTVSAAGKRAPLVWPPVFPVKAPAW
ncbi:type VI secretion system protein [Duganella sp. BJB475]|uniref:type VI secretion system protein n=1 Tax=Duganella sp. BJB475 TaxID=2233914 RepID=UPI001E46DBC5|nr:type VI secretion system protein [Duganella sp. BJB475]